MPVQIRFDSTHNVIQPTFVLATRKGKKLGKLPIYNLIFKDGMNTFSELSFRINKVDCVPKKDKVDTTHITPISISNTISTMTGFTRIGTLSENKYTELFEYFKVNNKLQNVKLKFVCAGQTFNYPAPSFSWDTNYDNLYLSETTGTTKLLKIDRQGNVYINNAQSIGLVSDNTCLVDFSFDVPVSLIKNEFWDNITDFKLIWAREWDMWFEMYVSLDESDETIKNVSAKALGEAELSQINLYDIEINTETDIEREDYKPTVLFNETDHSASLLHRITEKAPHYNFVHIDSSVANIQRTFTFDGTTIYDAFQEIAEEEKCLFIINCHTDTDGSILRDISVYDLESYCVECGERGDFLEHCSKCGSDNILPGYGEDTTIFVSTTNLADNITYQTDEGSVKNCFKLEAGDDLLTATIINCNPNGSGYIWYISDEIKKDMSRSLVNKLADYDEEYEYYQSEYSPNISLSIVEEYNDLIDKYSEFSNDHDKITLPIVGYHNIMKAYYDVIDFYYYLKNSMMPNIELENTNAMFEASKLTYESLSPVSLQKLTASTSSSTVSNAVLSVAKTIVNSNYQVKILADETIFTDNMWSGVFVVTNYANDEDTYTTNRIVVNVTQNYENFVKQKINKSLSQNNKAAYDIVDIFNLDSDDFEAALKQYSLSRLNSFYDSCQSCLDILLQQGIADRDEWINQSPNLYTKLYLPFYNKLQMISEEISVRQREIDIIDGTFDEYGDIKKDGMRTILEKENILVQNALNFENFLGEDLWLEFVAYRREDTYENQNFISDGLNNKELFDKALEFIDVAKKDIVKSATLQHSINASLKNVLVMKEFEPIVEYFKVGNWLRVKVDDKIYRLRLLDYEIDFDNLDRISITFSDVNSVKGGVSDVESVLNQATSIASSYGEVARQAKQGKRSSDQLNDWVAKGLSLTKMKIVDNADNQDISWDSHGLLCREYLPITDSYDSKQLKIISKGLYLTDDNWLTSRAGIGNFTYWNPQSGEVEESYGVIADTLVGNLILGEEVGIYNKKNSISLDENGLTIVTDGDIQDNNQTVFKIQKKYTQSGNELYKDLLTIDENGDLILNGDIKINSTNYLNVDSIDGIINYTDSAITQTSNAIISEVNNKFLSYSTTEQTRTMISQTSDTIMLEVNKKVNNSEFGTKITQNATSVQLAWNNISKYIEFSGGAMNIYTSTAQGSSNLLMKLNSSGNWFYHNGSTIGKIGVNNFTGRPNFKGLVFDLENGAKYMAWAHMENSSDSAYTIQFAYYADDTVAKKGLHFDCDAYVSVLHLNEYVQTARYSDGSAGLYSNSKEININGKGVAISGNGAPFTCNGDFYFYNSQNKKVNCYNNIDLFNYDILNQSDARYKKNIVASPINTLKLLNDIEIKSFDWIETDEHIDVGIIAQQLQEICPQLVYTDTENGKLSIKTDKLIPYLIKALQELTTILASDNKYKKVFNEIGIDTSEIKNKWKDKYSIEEKKTYIGEDSKQHYEKSERMLGSPEKIKIKK